MRKFLLWATLLLIPPSAWAQQQAAQFADPPKTVSATLGGPMRFTWLPKQKALLMWGGIHSGDLEHFRAALDASHPKELWLASGGGDLTEAIEIGHMVRSYKLTTRVPNDFRCVSACNFIFMGGVVRFVDTRATFEVHMFAARQLGRAILRHVEFAPEDVFSFKQRYPDDREDLLDPKEFANAVRVFATALNTLATPGVDEKTLKEAVGNVLVVLDNPAMNGALFDVSRSRALKVIRAANSGGNDDSTIKVAKAFWEAFSKDDQLAMFVAWAEFARYSPLACPGGGLQTADSRGSAPPSLPPATPSAASNSSPNAEPPSPTPVPPKPSPSTQTTPPSPPQPVPVRAVVDQPRVDFPDDPCMQALFLRFLEIEAMSQEVKVVQQSSAQIAATIARFLTDMSISLRFLTEFANIPNDLPRPLTRQELHSFNIVNVD